MKAFKILNRDQIVMSVLNREQQEYAHLMRRTTLNCSGMRLVSRSDLAVLASPHFRQI